MEMQKSESPLACNLFGLTPAQRERKRTLDQQVRAGVAEVRELPDGYALRIPTDTANVVAAAEWMSLEKLCCPFLTLAVECEREAGGTWLKMTGRAGVKEFLQVELKAFVR